MQRMDEIRFAKDFTNTHQKEGKKVVDHKTMEGPVVSLNLGGGTL
jgi:hypothetical protein